MIRWCRRGGGRDARAKQRWSFATFTGPLLFLKAPSPLTHLRVSTSQALHDACITFIHWRAWGWRRAQGGAGGRRGAPCALPEAASAANLQSFPCPVPAHPFFIPGVSRSSARVPPGTDIRNIIPGYPARCQGPTRHRHKEHLPMTPLALPGPTRDRHQEHHTRVPLALPGPARWAGVRPARCPHGRRWCTYRSYRSYPCGNCLRSRPLAWHHLQWLAHLMGGFRCC